MPPSTKTGAHRICNRLDVARTRCEPERVSGGEPVSIDTVGTDEGFESVGNWRFPAWIHRVSWPAWIFIGLAIADFLASVAVHAGPAGIDWPNTLNPTFLGAIAAGALPILLPAAVLWRIGQPVPRLTEPLVAGSITLAASVLLTTLASGFDAILQPDQGLPASNPIAMAVRLVAVALAIVGPVLIGRAILSLRGADPARWVFWAGSAIVALTAAYVAYYLYEASTMLGQLQGSTLDEPGFVDFTRTQTFYAVLGGIWILGQSYLAWVIVSATGDRAQPRRAWLMAFVGIVVVEILAAFGVFILFASTNLPALMPPSSDLLASFFNATSTVRLVLELVAWILIVAGFALGFGRPAAAEDVARAEA